MMVLPTSGEEDELSMTVSDLSVQGRRVSDRSRAGDDISNDIDSKLDPILRRMSSLEEQFAATYREDSEAAARRAKQTDQLEKLWHEWQEERRQRQTPEASVKEGSTSGDHHAPASVLEATAAAREAESQLIWVTAEARNVERDFDHIIAEARTLLDKELQRRLESEASGRSKVDNASASSCTAECLSLRLEALEVHVNARLESLEESVSTFWDELQKEIQKNATYRVEESLNVQTMINKSLEVERVERNKLIEEEKTRHEERQNALARALGEELEASIVAQAVAEVRKAACTAAQEEAKAQVEQIAPPKEHMEMLADSFQQLAELRQKVSELDSRWRDSGFSCLPSPTQLDPKAEPAGSMGRSADKGVMALQQFGVSVVQLESNINSLLKSSLEARAEQNQQHTNVHEEMKQLRSEINTIAHQDIARLWEQLQKLQGGYGGKLESVCKENASIARSHSPTPPNGVPQWRLAMVPSPARSPHDRCSKSQQGSLAVRVASPSPRQADPTPAHSRSTSPGGRFSAAHSSRRTTPGISAEVEAGSRGGAVSPGRPSSRGGKLVTSCLPGPPRRTVGT